MPIISVIVPVYKVEHYLHRCVDSVLRQSFTDFELILVDDGSPDNCPVICDQYAVQDKRVHVIHQQNGGLSAARNAGIDWSFEYSDSKWITFIDSDDWVSEFYLERLYQAVCDLNVNLSICATYKTNGAVDTTATEHKIFEKISIEAICEIKREDILLMIACGKLYNKFLWREIRFPLGKFHEDVFTTHRLIYQNNAVALVYEKLYYYFQNENGITGSEWNPNRLDELEGLRSQIEYFKENNFPSALEKSKRVYLYVLAEHLHTLNKLYPRYNYCKKILRKQLRKDIRKYKKTVSLSIDEYRHIYEAVYPFWMRQYWRLQKLLRIMSDERK